MAGAITQGFYLKFQALNTQLNKLSAKPFANFPRVLADTGATSKRSDIFVISMWRTGSDLYYHVYHSSISLNHINIQF